jgi:hypothetical protein
MSVLGQKQTSQGISRMSALPPKADINYRERNVGFVPSCSVDNLARNTEGAHERPLCSTTMRSKKFNLPAGPRSPAQKVYILHKKLSPHGALCAKPATLIAAPQVNAAAELGKIIG